MIYKIIFLFLLSSCALLKEGPSEQEIPGKYHRVKDKETISQIAKKYKINEEEIKDINGIENNRLVVGQLLFIPDPDPILRYIEKNKTKSITKPKVLTNKKLLFPVENAKIVKNFSLNKKDPYEGVLIKSLSKNIKSALDGKVIFVGDDGTRFGLLAIIEHEAPFITVYTNLSKAHVKIGQRVKKGEVIALMGNFLHFQVRVNERPKDPLLYLAK